VLAANHPLVQQLLRRGRDPRWPPGIIIHHSDTPAVLRGRPVTVEKIAEMHRRRGFATVYQGRLYTIGYHYVILPDGVVQQGRPDLCPGAHSRGPELNRYLGICLIGDFSGTRRPSTWWPRQPTEAQMRSLEALCRRLMAKYEFGPDRIFRHSDVRQTLCPGSHFPFARLLTDLKSSATAVRRAAAPAARELSGS
jgi:hypothetical protein